MIILLLLGILSIIVYWYLTKNFNYWKVRNIPFVKPTVIVGSLMPMVKREKSLGQLLRDIYEKYPDDPFVGMFLGSSPCVLVRDYETARNIVNKDLEHFSERMMMFDENRENIESKSLFSLRGQTWKSARQSMTPGFTALKLKQYFNEMMPLTKELYQRIEANRVQDLMQMCWCLSVDAINRPMFGLKSKALLNADDDLLHLSKKLYKTDLQTNVAKFCLFAAPNLYAKFGLRAFPADAINVIKKLTSDIIDNFSSGAAKPSNVMAYLHDLYTKEMEKPGERPFAFDRNGTIGQVFALLVAGTDTITATMAFTLYELAKHPQFQERLRQEVAEAFPGGVDTFTYEKINSLKYLSMVINETVRLDPPFPFLDRVCTKDYVLPGTDCKIEKGVFVFIAMWGMHTDKKHWENPNEFNPDRFDDMTAINGKPFFPFGTGVRQCIGMKYALMEAQLLLTSLVLRYRWHLAPGDDNFKLNPLTYTTMPDRPVKIIFEPLDK